MLGKLPFVSSLSDLCKDRVGHASSMELLWSIEGLKRANSSQSLGGVKPLEMEVLCLMEQARQRPWTEQGGSHCVFKALGGGVPQ